MFSRIIFIVVLFFAHLSAHSTNRVLFSPDDKPRNHLLKLLNNAKHRIYAALYLLTDKKLATALINAAHYRGVDVQVVTDQTCLLTPYNKIRALQKYGIAVFIYPSVRGKKSTYYAGIMHNKFAIIDSTVWSGSFNWTVSANTRNHENVLICEDEKTLRSFVRKFAQLKRACVVRRKRKRRWRRKS